MNFLKRIRTCSFDVGRKNLAFYTEDILIDDIKKLNKKFTSLRKEPFYSKEKFNKNIYDFTENIFSCGKRVDGGMGVFDIRHNANEDILDYETRKNLIKLLNYYTFLWKTCDIIVIEKQFVSRNISKYGINMKAIKISECILFWFLEHYSDYIQIFIFESKYKTELLGAPKFVEKNNKKTGKKRIVKMTKYDRKKWSVEKGKDIMKKRDDEECLIMMRGYKNTKQKLDDVCDCVVQLQAFYFKYFIIK